MRGVNLEREPWYRITPGSIKLIERSWQCLCWLYFQSVGLTDNETDNEMIKVLCDAHRLPENLNLEIKRCSEQTREVA